MLSIIVEGEPGVETQKLAGELATHFAVSDQDRTIPKEIKFFLTANRYARPREGRYLIIIAGLTPEEVFWTAYHVCRWELVHKTTVKPSFLVH